MSQDDNMMKAYLNGQDLYAVIAQSMYDNNYEDNLEFYIPSVELTVDGKKVMTGDDSASYELEFSDTDLVELKLFNYINIETKGDVQAAYLEIGDKITDGPVIRHISKLTDKVIIGF